MSIDTAPLSMPMALPSSTQTAVAPVGPAHADETASSPLRVALRLCLVALLCGALQAWLPHYDIGADNLGPLSVVLGLAVGAAATRGRWTVPAALLGVAVADWLSGTALRQGVLDTVVIGAQATLAGWMLRHGNDAGVLMLDTQARLKRFLLLVAPLTAALGALAHSAVLATNPGAEGYLLPVGAAARLLADWAGIVVTAPVLWCWLAQPAQAWRHRRRMLALPLAALSAMMLFGFAEVARRDEVRLAVRFDREAAARQARVRAQLADPLDALHALRGALAAGGGSLPAPLFDELAKPWAEQHPELVGLGWFERATKGNLRQADPRLLGEPPVPESQLAADAQVLALRHAYGQRQGALAALGLADSGGVNALSVPALRRGLQRAAASNQAVVSTGFRLSDQGPGQSKVGALLMQALPAGGASPGAGGASVAYALLDLDLALSQATPAGDEFVSACLTDPEALPDQRRLAGRAGCDTRALAPNDRAQSSRVVLGDRRLNLVIVQAAGADTRILSAVWLLALPTVIGMAMLSALLLALSGRLRRIEDRVAERTLALRAEIDERRQAQRALTESEQRFRAIFDSVNVGVTLVDMQGRIAMANPAFCAMTGYTQAELLQRPLDDIRLPDVAEDDGTAAALAGDQARRQRYLTGDGRVLQVATSVRTLSDASGNPVATVAALQDLTDMLRLREAEREREHAVAANRTKTDFLSRLSHELRAPLNAIIGFAQMLSDTEGSPADPVAQARALAQIRQTGWHLADMVNDVLDLARIEAGQLRLTLQPVPLAELLTETLGMVEPVAVPAQIELRIDQRQGAEAAQADPVRLRQVLINLLGNAIKYNRRGGWVELRVSPDSPGMLLFEVQDNGIGMSELQLAELFTPFNRLGRDASVPQGTGIGLVICQRLVELMGGEMSVTSREGEGSTFTFRLPRGQLPVGATRPSPLGAARASVHGSQLSPLGPAVSIGRVLYIEDRAADVEVMRGWLKQRPGVELLSASTGQAGLAAAGDADLVLLDLDLPDMPGLAVLRALQADPHTRATPVIMVSADTSPERIDACFDLGARHYLTKPVDVQQLLRAVDEALQS